ncbi:glycosyltransferase family 4 protein [Pontiellaceae bacterium B12219]|nr:glycosyltransferase family 4 protein [Pontiellaceae bacterium B12219]
MKILVYDDNPDFGGHQVMAAFGIEALAADPEIDVVCMVNPKNRKLLNRLAQVSSLQTQHADPAVFQSLEPDRVLCIQGDVAQSAKGILAAKRAGIECISYLALPHPLAEMGAKLGLIRDLMHQPLLRKPDRYIVISESMKQLLRKRGAKQPVQIVPNGIQPPPPAPQQTRSKKLFTIALLGRIEFSQKQQDFFVRTFLKNPDLFSSCRLLIVGSGPDEHQLKKQIENHDGITLLPWQTDMEAIYTQTDMLVIPSRYEGVPLVMLEALARGIPVIGSCRDGMQDILPPEWTFTTENAAALLNTFSKVRKNGFQQIRALQTEILKQHSIEAFKGNFVRAVTGQ